jgi:hypothetical protein
MTLSVLLVSLSYDAVRNLDSGVLGRQLQM